MPTLAEKAACMGMSMSRKGGARMTRKSSSPEVGECKPSNAGRMVINLQASSFLPKEPAPMYKVGLLYMCRSEAPQLSKEQQEGQCSQGILCVAADS